MNCRTLPTMPATGRLLIRSSRLPVFAATLVLLYVSTLPLAAREPLDPLLFGYKIPSATPAPPSTPRVTTRDESGKAVVAKVHVEVGDYRIVLLPDGQLVARAQAETEMTEKPFKPLTTDELARQIMMTFPGFKAKTTRRYACVYNTSDEFAAVATRVLDTMLPGVKSHMTSLKIAVHEPDVPLLAMMFRTAEEFQRFEKLPAGVQAFYKPSSNTIVMYEESPLFRVNRELAIRQSLATIAHEGAHQILHNIGVQQRLSVWPIWIAEGLAEYFAPTTVGRRFEWKGAGNINDLRMLELELFLQLRNKGEPGAMVSDTVAAARLTSTGYAASWSLTHFLAKNHRDPFHDFLAELVQLGPLEGKTRVLRAGRIPENSTHFRRHFGEDLGQLEEQLVAYLLKLPYNDPFAEHPHFVATVSYTRGESPQREASVFHVEGLAAKWSEDTVKSLAEDEQQSAALAMRQFPNRKTAVQFAKQYLRGK
ncbi:MAG: DUF1570 domain-containing protein [Planctomycetes bacterium]|nr:DUF1570 domain-containing protein [Planctomycetota bacterium]